MSRGVAAAAMTLLLAATASAAQQAGPPAGRLGRIGIEDRLEQASLAIAALDRARVPGQALPIFARLSVPWSALELASTGQWSVVDARLDLYQRRGLPVLLSIGAPSGALAAGDTWVPVVRAMAEHLRGRIAVYQIEAARPRPSPQEYAFRLKLAAVQIKASDPQALIAQEAVGRDDTVWLGGVYAEGTAPYVDVVPLVAQDGIADGSNGQSEIDRLVGAYDPSAARLQIGVPLAGGGTEGAGRLLTVVLQQLGRTNDAGSTFSAAIDSLAPALSAAFELRDLISGEVLSLDDTSVFLAILAEGRNVTTSLAHRLFFNASNGGTYLVYWGIGNTADRLTFSLIDQRGRAPVLRDPIRKQAVPVGDFSWNQTTKVASLTSRGSAEPLVLDFNYGASNEFVSRAEVTAAVSLSADEIVARNQQAQTAQTNSFKTLMASLRLELHFRPSATQVFDVVSENQLFSAPDAVEWEERSFSVNGAKWGPDHPGLPLLQAEKVLSLPLELGLTADYRYSLEGDDTIDGRRCYVVAFSPVDPARARYRGRVWIDAENFLRRKTQSIQTHLEGPIVSNEEIALYEPVPTGRGTSIVVATRLSTKQILLIAGRNLLLEKEQWFSEFRVDAPGFDAERQAARDSRHVMFRDTPAGVRYLVQRGAERVVSNNIRTSSRALAMGTTIDPAFAFPLPILGLNYLNFDLKGTGGQMALLFGGVFALGNIQTPKLGKTPFDASVDFFGIAVPGTDVRFDAAGERKDEQVMTVPMSAGLNLGYQFTSFQRAALGYVVRYDAYFHSPETAHDFVMPSSSATNGVSVDYEYSRHGYRLRANASALARTSWKAWGRPDDLQPAAKTYRRHSASVTKDFLFGPFQSAHVSAAWYDGARLDRFNMYQFGLFDEVRMHGVPSAGIRFPSLALFRGSYSFNLFDIYRLDLFIDHARGRDPNDRAIWRPVTGTGVAVTLKTPWNTMFSADVGKSLIPEIYAGTGSVVLQFLLLKPL